MRWTGHLVRGRRVGCISLGIGLVMWAGAWGGDGDSRPASPGLPAARGAVEPAAPVLPDAVVEAMQEGRYAEARQALLAFRERATGAEDRVYLRYLAAVAERLAGRRAEARDLLQAALREAPEGRWAAKVRFELADVELASGNLAAAEELTRAEATRLLAPGRKDRLAEVYRTFALKRLKPSDPVVPPDPAGAYQLLEQARELARGDVLRAELLDAMGQASLDGGQAERAVENFELICASTRPARPASR